MAQLNFKIEFNGPFRVATGYARDGLDIAADPDQPLPATALKGLARHHAAHVLGAPPALIDATFGSVANPSPWSWTDADFDEIVTNRRAQTAIDSETGRPRAGTLRLSEELWCPAGSSGHFRISNERRLTDTQLIQHITLLVASTCAIHAVGSDRRRGLGWCTVILDSTSGLPADVELHDGWATTIAELWKTTTLAQASPSTTSGAEAHP